MTLQIKASRPLIPQPILLGQELSPPQPQFFPRTLVDPAQHEGGGTFYSEETRAQQRHPLKHHKKKPVGPTISASSLGTLHTEITEGSHATPAAMA